MASAGCGDVSRIQLGETEQSLSLLGSQPSHTWCQGMWKSQGEALTGGAVDPVVPGPCAVTLVSSQADPHTHPLVLAGEIATGIHCKERKRDTSPPSHHILHLVAPCSSRQDTAPPGPAQERRCRAAGAKHCPVVVLSPCLGGCCAPGAPAQDKAVQTAAVNNNSHCQGRLLWQGPLCSRRPERMERASLGSLPAPARPLPPPPSCPACRDEIRAPSSPAQGGGITWNRETPGTEQLHPHQTPPVCPRAGRSL